MKFQEGQYIAESLSQSHKLPYLAEAEGLALGYSIRCRSGNKTVSSPDTSGSDANHNVM
jgi:hypothetical protein